MWLARGDDGLLGVAGVLYGDGASPGEAVVYVRVTPAARRRGIGTALVRAMVPDILVHDRNLISAYGVRADTVGAAWAASLGFATVQRRIWQRLDIPAVKADRWQTPLPEGFRFEKWTDRAPDHLVAGFAQARNAILDAPIGEASYERPSWTVEKVRRQEAELREFGREKFVVIAVHEESNAVAALTELSSMPKQEDICWQRDTAVVKQFRGLGLGRAVKSAMMRWVLADRPSVEVIRTDVDASNQYMLRVNEQLGYTVLSTVINMETSLESLAGALGIAA
jgi:GNAT superfamily N-acetyltransferase